MDRRERSPAASHDAAAQLGDRLARGVTFLCCRNTISGATRKLVAAGLGSASDVRTAIEGAIIPGVITVPAMVVAFTQMQERGVAYVFAG